jgi:hypothetical protein
MATKKKGAAKKKAVTKKKAVKKSPAKKAPTKKQAVKKKAVKKAPAKKKTGSTNDIIITHIKRVMTNIINQNLSELKQGNLCVKPGYFNYDRFFLDRVSGSYQDSLQSLIHYIMYDDGLYEKILTPKEMIELNQMVKESPFGIYHSNDREELFDEIYSESISFVANTLKQKGIEFDEELDEYL